MRLKELARKIGADPAGLADIEISGAAGVREAGPGYITYITGEQYFKDLATCRAAAVIVPLGAPDARMPLLRVKNPRLAFAQTLALLYVKPYAPTGISDRAVIGRDAVIGAEPSVHPYAVVEDGARIGSRVTLYPGVYVGRGTVIGDDCTLYSAVSVREGVTIGSRVIIHSGTVIGSDGFGFVTDGGMHHKIPQVGGVIIGDDVEIGANCTIDRATLGNTVIKKGTKLDNLVHIAHNVTAGEHCLIAAQVGIAGSTTIGSYVVFGGQVGVADHITISDGVMASAQAGIIKDPGPRQIVGGTYAMPHREWLKVQAVLPKLPELKRLVAELEKQVKELKQKGEKS
jgi:UDP-3-O-[3-hydroxymyristoyl] glucosamine N-acyltransferase